MKFKPSVRLAASLVVLTLLAACASQQKKDEASTAPGSGATASSAAGSPQAEPGSRGSVAGASLNDPKSILSQRSVFYDFDQYSIKTNYRAIVEQHARYLKAHPGANITVQGNCDERGSREYNLALGQRRADGVKGMLTVLGVPDRQIETVSFGEEKPQAAGHDESAWSKNRRSDIVYRKID